MCRQICLMQQKKVEIFGLGTYYFHLRPNSLCSEGIASPPSNTKTKHVDESLELKEVSPTLS